MVTNILAAVLISQIATASKKVVWVVTPSQRELDFGRIISAEASPEDIERELGLCITKIEDRDVVLFVSDAAFPVTSFEKSLAWINSSVGVDKQAIDPNSENGKELLDFIQTKYFMDSFQSPPEKKPIGTTLGLIIRDPNHPEFAPHLRPLLDPRTLDRATVTPKVFGDDMSALGEYAKATTKKSSIFPNARDRSEITIVGYKDDAVQSINSKEMLQVSSNLLEIATKLQGLETAHRDLLTSKLNDLGSSLMNDFPGVSRNAWKFSELPESIRGTFEKSFVANWEVSGFQSEQEARNYLNTNPNLRVEFALVAYAAFTKPGDPPGISSGYAQFIKP